MNTVEDQTPITFRNNVKIFGHGTKPMMFAHGFGCDQNMWRFISPSFENDYKIILFDYDASMAIEARILLLNKFREMEGKYKYLEFVKLQIRDQGVGFNNEYQKQAFDLFRKLHPATGSGIGLSLCKKIVENHAGTISLQSQEGEGTVIIIFLPLRQENN